MRNKVASAKPPAIPNNAPQPNCCRKSSAIVDMDEPPWTSLAISAMKATVRYTAIGSLTPDSISSVVATRSLSKTPERLSSANTAAASVEPTMAPSNKAVFHSRPTKITAATAVMPALITTPSDASSEAGLSPVRNVA